MESLVALPTTTTLFPFCTLSCPPCTHAEWGNYLGEPLRYWVRYVLLLVNFNNLSPEKKNSDDQSASVALTDNDHANNILYPLMTSEGSLLTRIQQSHNLALYRVTATTLTYNRANRAVTMSTHYGDNRTTATTLTLSSPKVPFNSLSYSLVHGQFFFK